MTHPKTKQPSSDYLQQFNIDEFNEEGETPESAPTSEKEDFGALLSESFKSQEKKLKVGDQITGKILNLGSADVFITTGTRFDGILNRTELLDAQGNCPYKVGDFIQAYVTLIKNGEVRLSKNGGGDQTLASDLITAFQDGMPIQGRIVEVCKGGVKVNIKGKLAFCPISQIDSRHIESAEEYVGKSFAFKITQFSEGGRNIVVSRRKLLDAERELGTSSFLSEKKDGDIVTGRVVRFEPFGAFIELAPGVEGMVHISEIAWSRISSPSEVLKLGETVTVKLLKREVLNGKAKIALSIKQANAAENENTSKVAPPNKQPLAHDDPWSKLSPGQQFQGKVNRKEPYGLFVQIEPGITGLLHKSRTQDARDFHFEKVRVNDTIAVQIAEIRVAERQISLTLPQDTEENDWKSHYKQDSTASLGTFGAALGSKMTAALKKK